MRAIAFSLGPLLALLAACNSNNKDDRATIFRLRKECAAIGDKVRAQADLGTSKTHIVDIYSVFYSRKLNTCLVAKHEIFLDPGNAAQYISIEDSFTQHDVWSLDDHKNPIPDWDIRLQNEISALQ